MKISFGRKIVDGEKTNDYSEIWINGILTFDNIPIINYQVHGKTPVAWIVDRYKIKFDKDSGIVNEPGDVDIISILERAVYVGVESDKIIKNLPNEFEPKDWTPKKSGLEKFAE